MNIFVLSTGRSGTLTFERACRWITNFTCGHETRTMLLGPHRLDYPEKHIEADNRLCWLLGRLDEKYGKDAFYVNLIRDREATARSYATRYDIPRGMMRAYYHGIHMMPVDYKADPPMETLMAAARDLWDTVNGNVSHFLKDKPGKIIVHLEDPKPSFSEFWRLIEAEGDEEAALAEWDVKHHARPESRPFAERSLGEKAAHIKDKLLRIREKLPHFIRNA